MNTQTNIRLNVVIPTVGVSSTVNAVAVPQQLKVNTNKLSYGSTNIVNNFITINNNSTVSAATVANNNTLKETSTYTISGIIPYNKFVTLASITITADAGYLINKKLGVKKMNNKNLQIVLQKVTSSKTSTVYHLVCKAKTLNLMPVNVLLDQQVSKNMTIEDSINRIIFDSPIIKADGAVKEFKVKGTKNTSFNLFLLDSDDEPIVTSESRGVTSVGVKECISSQTNTRGEFKYKHKFPSIKTIKETTVNGNMAASGASTIIFASLNGVQVGDQIVMMDSGKLYENATTKNKIIKVLELNPNGNNVNECTLTDSIKAANGKEVLFKRGTQFKLHLTSNKTSSLIPSTYPSFTLNQYLKPLLNFKATSAVGALVINGGSAGADDFQSFDYKNNRLKLKYILTGKTNTVAAGFPKVSDLVVSSGDTTFSVYNAKATGSGTATVTLEYEVIVNKWGVQDTLITIDLDQIVS